MAELIRAARSEAGLTQEELAAASGVSRVSIAVWEIERRSRDGPLVIPSERKLLAVTRHLGIDDGEARRALARLKIRAAQEAVENI